MLKVSRDASTREIRQAFKRLALTMHPDKNPGDSLAHDRFLEVNRAYEVLKDADLRKKYDKYGEKGLDEQQQGGGYESWNFYRYDFGIYDDDLEVITLDSGDFEAAVNSGEIWFINFYFPRCSHCHELAPTWREFAKEMDGVMRIGAVNCGDNNHLCRSKGINSYPSLYVYKAGQFITTSVTELWQGNVFSEIETAYSSGMGWLITFCSDTGDCLEPRTRQKDGLVKVGWMDCTSQQHLCDSFQVTSGATALFPPGSTLDQKGSVLWLNTLDSREIYNQVINHLPDLELLTGDSFKIHTYTLYHINLLPVSRGSWPIIAGMGIHDFEIHHGKDVLYNIVGFARDSVRAHVNTLRPDNFPSEKDRKEPWLVDFFAPEGFHPAGRADEVRHSGLYIHQNLCSMYNIQAYPTTVIFNGSSVHEYEGQHSADGILEFIQDLVNPSVMVLDPDSFNERVKGRGGGQLWAVDFYAPWCGPCQALIPEWRRMARMLSGQIQVGSVDCKRFQTFCQNQGVRAYPEIRLYLGDPRNADRYMTYNGWHRDAHSLKSWALALSPGCQWISPDFRSQVLSGQDHWVLDFYAPWCGPCQHFAPEFYPYLGTRRHEHSGEYINSRDANVIDDIITQRLQKLAPRSNPNRNRKHLKSDRGFTSFFFRRTSSDDLMCCCERESSDLIGRGGTAVDMIGRQSTQSWSVVGGTWREQEAPSVRKGFGKLVSRLAARLR
ncbi:hypothetical protein F7725_002541 [Dissostichus mawsoni]|uniref:DnaJ homolog subfamily C member 10 n=1 Tax=Dissostichus mawsoni TaxID=36200 RepID=A0A7J5Y2N1_DISMA|nr:hypothetical protein F7725_002541 [Dissostichus mawsoni]